MASITFSGQLDQAMNEAAAEGNKVLFIPQQTVGEVLPGAASELVVESDGTYSITLAYNTYSIYSYSDVTKRKTLIANDIVVSADTVVTTIPDLIGSTIPVTEDGVLAIQGYLAEANDSASSAATSESNAAASAASVANRAAAYEAESTNYLINTFDGSTLDAGDVVRTLGYYSAGDGGGAEWVKSGDTGTASQGPESYYTEGAFLTDSSGVKYEISEHDKANIDSRKLGINESSTDNFERLSCCALASSDNMVMIYDDVTSDDDNQITFADITFVGPGSISGLYRKHVFPVGLSCPTPKLHKNIKPIVANKSDTVTAVLTGDSISTYSANSRDRTYMLTGLLREKLQRELGEVNFYDRAISGATFSGLDGVSGAASNVEWYTDTSADWLDYIEELTPDVVFISFGMNDNSNISIESMDSVVSKIRSWDVVPQIIMLTCLVPSLSGNANGDYATEANQESRDYAAGIVRSYCSYHSIGLIDVNRACNLARDGMDNVYGRIGQSETVTINSSGTATGTIDCHNFRAEVTIDESLFTDGESVWFYTDTNSKGRIVLANNDGEYRVTYGYADASQSLEIIDIVDTGISLGSSSNKKMAFELGADYFTGYVFDNTTLAGYTEPFIDRSIIRGGGFITPTVYTSNTGDFLTQVRFDYSDPYVTTPTIYDSLLWGEDDSSTSIRYWEGSGYNHPSSHVANFCYLPALGQFEFKAVNRTTVGDLVSSTNGVELIESSPSGVPYLFSTLLDSSGDSYASFKVNSEQKVRGVNISYLADSSGGTYVVLYIIVALPDGSYTFLRSTGAASTLDNSSDEIVNSNISFTSGSSIVNSGSVLTILRKGGNSLDDYGDLKLVSLALY